MKTLEQKKAENLNYIQTYKVSHEDEVEFQIIPDPQKAYFGCGQWRNTPEKIQLIRELGILHKFGPYQDCVSKEGMIEMVQKGWTTNDLEDIIAIFRECLEHKAPDSLIETLTMQLDGQSA